MAADSKPAGNQDTFKVFYSQYFHSMKLELGVVKKYPGIVFVLADGCGMTVRTHVECYDTELALDIVPRAKEKAEKCLIEAIELELSIYKENKNYVH